MDSFAGGTNGSSLSSSSSSSSPPPQLSKEDFMDQLKTQLALAYAEEFLETVRGSALRSVSPNQEAASAGVRVVAHLDVWIATLRPRVSSAELFLVQHDKLPSTPGGNEALGYRILRKMGRFRLFLYFFPIP